MANLPTNRASTLRASFLACNVDPLAGDDSNRYYVDLSSVRGMEVLQEIDTLLNFQESGQFSTILFTGHRGCGKSTELKRIQKEWEKDFQVIFLEVDEVVDINDIEYIDLYLIVIRQVEVELRKLGLKFDEHLLKCFEAWFKEVTKETEESVEKYVSTETEILAGGNIPFISRLLTKLLSQIRNSNNQKKIIRQMLTQNITTLRKTINFLLIDAFSKLKSIIPDTKGFLIIFDNMDRVPPKVGKHLFLDCAAQSRELNCTVLYTVPISVLCSSQPLSYTLGNPHIMPIVNIYELQHEVCELNYNEVGVEVMASIIEQRVVVNEVFEQRTVLLDLVKASGGHLRQLMQLMRSACITASARGHSKIQAEDVTYAVKQEQFNFERFIPLEHYKVLAKACTTKDIPKDEIGQHLLFNSLVMEYNVNSRWNYPNPVVQQSEAFQQALKAAL